MYIERNEFANIYVYVFMFYVEGRQANKKSFFHLLPSFCLLLCSVRSKSVTFWLLFGQHASIRFEIFSCVAHLYK